MNRREPTHDQAITALPLSPLLSPAPLPALGLLLMLVPLFVRATSTFSMMPGWDQDPIAAYDPVSGLGPSGSLLIDGLIVLGSVLIGVSRSVRFGIKEGLGVATLLAFMYAVYVGRADAAVLSMRVGFSWLSAAVAAGTLVFERDPRIRRLVLSCILGFAALLAIRAGVQVYIEHPQAVAGFAAHKPQFLLSHGWTPDSAMARAYERRLLQADATAWFSLSNVLASVSATMTLVFAGLFLAPMLLRKRDRDTQAPASTDAGIRFSRSDQACLIVGLSLSAFTLYLSDSKGGLAVVVVGFGYLALLSVLTRWRNRHLSPASASPILTAMVVLIALTAFIGPLALVAGRGLMGERLNELSMLFRWYYLQGATRIALDHPLTGVGTEGFQYAFMSAKPPLCPEDVSSPHSILFDYLACLGLIGGTIAGLVLVALAWRVSAAPFVAGAASPPSPPPPNPNDTPALAGKLDRQIVWLVPALTTIIASWLDTRVMTPELAGARLFGLLGWGAMSMGLLGVLAKLDVSAPGVRRLALAVSPAALALIAHCQVEVTASWPISVGWVFLFLGCCASLADPTSARFSAPHAAPTTSARVTPPGRIHRKLGVAFACFVPLVLCGAGAIAWRWESRVREAAEALQPVAIFSSRLRSIESERSADGRPIPIEQAAANLLTEIEHAAPALSAECSGEAVRDPVIRGITRLARAVTSEADKQLVAAISIFPTDWRTRRALSEVRIRASAAARACGDPETALRLSLEAIAAVAPETNGAVPATRPPLTPPATLLRARVLAYLSRAELLRSAAAPTKDPGPGSAEVAAALATFDQIAALDPFNPDIPYRSFQLAQELNDKASARRYAQRALELQRECRLDPLARGLNEQQIAELSAAAPPPGSAP